MMLYGLFSDFVSVIVALSDSLFSPKMCHVYVVDSFLALCLIFIFRRFDFMQ